MFTRPAPHDEPGFVLHDEPGFVLHDEQRGREPTNWSSSIPEWDQYAAAAGARRGVHRIEDRIGAVPVLMSESVPEPGRGS